MTNLLLTLMNGVQYLDNIVIGNVIFLAWNNDINEIVPVSSEEVFDTGSISFGGRTDFQTVIDLVEQEEEGTRLLLLSDGVFSECDRGKIERLKEVLTEKKDILVTVAVGSDADFEKLADLACPVKSCYISENVLTVLSSLFVRTFVGNSVTDISATDDGRCFIKRR